MYRGESALSIYSMQPNRGDHSQRDDWDQGAQDFDGQEARSGSGYVVIVLVVMAAVVLCITAFFVIRVLFSPSPDALPAFVTRTSWSSTTAPGPSSTQITGTPGQAQVAVNPQQGYINTLITVTGQGWWPGEPVFVILRSQDEGDGPGYAYAAAVADDRGSFRTALTFPNEMRWIGQEWAEVIARGTRSGLEAQTRFTLIAPTPTNTVPLPTAGPTSLPTETPLPTDTSSPTLTPTPDVIITDWMGEYYANTMLGGDPLFVRNDVAIDFNWGTGSPGPGMPDDQFSARWTRQQSFSEGFYRFTIASDDGVRFWIDGQLYVDEWHDGASPHSFDLYLPGGQHALHLEYYENFGGAMVQLGWELTQPPTPTLSPTLPPTPTSTNTPPPPPGPTDTPLPPVPPASALPDRWQAAYYANPLFNEPAVLVRHDLEVNFDWGSGSPGEGIPVDGFSAQWTGQQWLPGANYRYTLVADDGARLWIDGQVALNAWLPSPGQVYQTTIYLAEGIHTFQVDYYEVAFEARVHLWGEMVANPASVPSP
jgi:hypothetical protein